jgi:hypothetical protein
MMQGVVAEQMLGNEIFSGQGLLSRMLISWPESTTGTRIYSSEDVYQDPAIKRYMAICTALLERDLPVNEHNQLNPPKLELVPDAKKLYIEFHNYCDRNAATGSNYEPIRGLANKAAEHALRIAGVFTVASNDSCVSADAMERAIMERAIKLMMYYLNEAIRISSAGQINRDLKDAELLLKWLQEKNLTLIYPVLIYQEAPSRKLRSKQHALKIIRILEEHGWLSPVDAIEVDGKMRREVWRLTRV